MMYMRMCFFVFVVCVDDLIYVFWIVGIVNNILGKLVLSVVVW